MATVEAPRESGGQADSGELAGFGYKQELDRSLGNFSSFAAGFSYISILTGVIQLFAFGFVFAGPAVWWTWFIVLGGQMMVALCFAEMAGQYPLAGSVYNWSKRVAGDFSAWMTGWIYVVGSIVTVAAVAVAWQVVLPQVSTSFQFLGGSADVGTYVTKGGAQNALLLGAILVVFGTIVNMLGVKIMARINNFGVMAELIGASILVILLLFHITRGPGIVVHNLGLGAGHSWGYFGAFIIGGIMSAYVMYGFDTAGTLAEETNDPRRAAPPAIIRALIAASIIGGLLILLGDHGRQEHPRSRTSACSACPTSSSRRWATTLGNDLPGRLGDRDHRLHAGGDGVLHPAAVRDGARRPAAVRHPHRARVGHPARAGHSGAGRRHPGAGDPGHQHRQSERVPGPHLGGDRDVLHRLPRGHRWDAGQALARRMAAGRSRSVLLARALGHAGQRRRRRLRR